MKLAIGSDHVGLELKPIIIDYLKELGHEVEDFGPYTAERTDYPVYGKKVAEEIVKGNFDLGILICGTGVGISIGLSRLFFQLREANIIEAKEKSLTKVLIIPMKGFIDEGVKTVNILRKEGIYSQVYFQSLNIYFKQYV